MDLVKKLEAIDRLIVEGSYRAARSELLPLIADLLRAPVAVTDEMVERAVFAFGNQVAKRKLTWNEYKADQTRWPADHAKMAAQMRAALSAALAGEVG